jgi:hypothetical protein
VHISTKGCRVGRDVGASEGGRRRGGEKVAAVARGGEKVAAVARGGEWEETA